VRTSGIVYVSVFLHSLMQFRVTSGINVVYNYPITDSCFYFDELTFGLYL